MSRLEVMSPAVRKRRYYSVPFAGSLVGLKRSQSYAAAAAGEIPTEEHGRLLLVPRVKWDRKVQRLLGRARPISNPATGARTPEESSAVATTG